MELFEKDAEIDSVKKELNSLKAENARLLQIS